MSHKTLDLVIYGATGFTGKLAAQYIASKGPGFYSNFKWAIAGRDNTKLCAVRDTLVGSGKEFEQVPVIQADSFDTNALDALTARTKAVISFVGPYNIYGTPLIESCIRNGTHYADLAGEVAWIKEMIDRFEKEANVKKVKLIPACGFDSVPSDMGIWHLAQHFQQSLGEKTGATRGIVWKIKGGISGGTAASMLNATAPDNIKGTARAFRDPQCLNPTNSKNNLDKPDASFNSVWYDESLKSHLGPFLMGSVNSRNVRRSNGLLNYGEKFTYYECMRSNSRLEAEKSRLMLGAMMKACASPRLRPYVERKLPKPGTGPKMDAMLKSFCHMKFLGHSATTNQSAICNLKISGDPGYLMTARMLVEAGICLANESDDVGVYGFHTAASGLGESYFNKLKKNGFEVDTRSLSKL